MKLLDTAKENLPFTKVCTCCKCEKPLGDFYKHSISRGGLRPNCKLCCKQYNDKWKERNRERRKETNRLWHEKNSSRVASVKRKHRYGITEDQYNRMLLSQGGLCAICKNPFPKTPQVDHCHTTLKVRGLLCRACNIELGFFQALTPERISIFNDYLANPKYSTKR